jgi:hypothetical protein
MTWLCRVVARLADALWHARQVYVSPEWVLHQNTRKGCEE